MEPGSHERSLTAALRALAKDEASRGAAPDVEARLLAEVRSRARLHRGTPMKVYATAAVLVVAVALPIWQLAERPTIAPPLPQSDVLVVDTTTEFFPLTFSNVPVTGGQIIRLEVPQLALASFGVAPADSLDGSRPGMVLADVLVGEDGLARAVRFLRPGMSVAQQELPQ